jgi:hypothetical protein
MEPRAHIGYLVGYESTNIFRVWIPSQRKVVSTRDVTFDETRFYDPRERDLAYLLREDVEDIIEVVDIPYTRTSREIEEVDTDDEEEDSTQSNTREGESTQSKESESTLALPTPEATPEATPETSPEPSTSSNTLTPNSEAQPEVRTEAQITSTRPRPSREIIGDFGDMNIVEGTRNRVKKRRDIYFADLKLPEELPGYNAAFAAGTHFGRTRLHRDQLPDFKLTSRQYQTQLATVGAL